MPQTSGAASSTDVWPLPSFCAALMKSDHEVMGVLITVLSYIQPVEPKSLHTEYLLPGSNDWPVYCGDRFLKFGTSDRSSSSRRSFATIWGMYGPDGTTMS